MLVGDKAVMGPVELTVRDLAGMLEFYQRSIGLKLLQRTGNIASLGVSDQVLLTLLEDRQARHPGRTTGLYHVAILLPSRVALARQLNHLVKTGVYLQGAADHLVSEALYLADPEGNGIELYRDRPRSQWPHEHGQLRMASDPLDIDGLLAEPQLHSESWNGLPDGTVMGHVHLRVSDLPDAENFYRTVLGMDLMVRFGHSASFLSYGGYHHHIGINTWESLGRPAAPTGAQGLKDVVIRVPDMAIFMGVKAAVKLPPTAPDEGKLRLRDPSGNALVILPP